MRIIGIPDFPTLTGSSIQKSETQVFLTMGAISALSVISLFLYTLGVAWANNYGYGSYGYNYPTNISSPHVTQWGIWGHYESCPYGKFVTGFQLKVDPYTGPTIPPDDTGLQGIKFFCGDRSDPNTELLTSTVGTGDKDGFWKGDFDCHHGGVLVGFQLRVQNQTGADNIATGNFRGFCHAGYAHNEELLEGDGVNEVGDWGDVIRCPRNHAFCGLQTQVEPYQGADGAKDDDTSLNSIVVGCCPRAMHHGYYSPHYYG